MEAVDTASVCAAAVGAVVAVAAASLPSLLPFEPQPDNNAAETPATSKTLTNFILNPPISFNNHIIY
ncbi:hypothetical protein D3C86_1992970 [compost metagenome]